MKKEEFTIQDATSANLYSALRSTRYERGGISIENISYIIQKVFDTAEIEALRKELKERITCEKCGGELKTTIVGDESYDKCVDCGWITH